MSKSQKLLLLVAIPLGAVAVWLVYGRDLASNQRRSTPQRNDNASAREHYQQAAASIVAKVTRDRLMTRLGLLHPGYGFEHHKGYSVPEHFDALARLGPTIHHRRSFAPVAACCGGPVAAQDSAAAADAAPVALPLE